MSELHRFLSELYAGQQGVLELRTFDHPQANKLRNFVAVIDGQYEHAPGREVHHRDDQAEDRSVLRSRITLRSIAEGWQG
jgi:hypothetical protein